MQNMDIVPGQGGINFSPPQVFFVNRTCVCTCEHVSTHGKNNSTCVGSTHDGKEDSSTLHTLVRESTPFDVCFLKPKTFSNGCAIFVSTTNVNSISRRFASPPRCLNNRVRAFVKSRCADCGAPCADWASVAHGSFVCLNCAEQHRGLGMHVTFTRSLTMDKWTGKLWACRAPYPRVFADGQLLLVFSISMRCSTSCMYSC